MKKSVLRLLAVFLIINLLCINLFAQQPASNAYDELSFQNSNITSTIQIPSNYASFNSNIQSDFSIQSNYATSNLIFSNTSTISANGDFYFFSLPSSKALTFKIQSTNQNCVMQLGIVNWDTSTIQLTSIYRLAGASTQYSITDGVPAGDYVFYIYAADNVTGATYNMYVNAANPSGYTRGLKITSDLSNVTMYYGNTTIFANGVNPLEQPITFDREDNWPLEGGIQWVNHTVNSGIVQEVQYGSFTSTKCSSDNALKIILGEGTLWTFRQQVNMADGSGRSDFIDGRNLQTPRYFDSVDAGNNYLVYDFNTSQYIYFNGPLNLFLEAEQPQFIDIPWGNI